MANDDKVKPAAIDVEAVSLTVAHALSVLKSKWGRAERTWVEDSIPKLVANLMDEAPELRLDYFDREEVAMLVTGPIVEFAWGCVLSALELLAALDPPMLVVPKPPLSVVSGPVNDDDLPPIS
jgi:hypothetical protein